jgi:hypothetical protein
MKRLFHLVDDLGEILAEKEIFGKGLVELPYIPDGGKFGCIYQRLQGIQPVQQAVDVLQNRSKHSPDIPRLQGISFSLFD